MLTNLLLQRFLIFITAMLAWIGFGFFFGVLSGLFQIRWKAGVGWI